MVFSKWIPDDSWNFCHHEISWQAFLEIFDKKNQGYVVGNCGVAFQLRSVLTNFNRNFPTQLSNNM